MAVGPYNILLWLWQSMVNIAIAQDEFDIVEVKDFAQSAELLMLVNVVDYLVR